MEGGIGGRGRRRRWAPVFCSDSSPRPEKNRETAEKWVRSLRWWVRGGPLPPEKGLPPEPPPRRFLLLLNPFGGRGQALSWCQSHVLPMISEANISFSLIQTERPNHAREVVMGLRLQEWDGIVTASGDGLLFEVVNGLLSRPDWAEALRTPLGVLPCGTGNGLAATISWHWGLPPARGLSLLQNCSLLLCRAPSSRRGDAEGDNTGDGTTKPPRGCPLDLVSVTTSSGRRLFSFLSVAWGLVADVDVGTERLRRLGPARFALGTVTRLLSLQAYRGRLSYLPALPRSATTTATTTATRDTPTQPHTHPGTALPRATSELGLCGGLGDSGGDSGDSGENSGDIGDIGDSNGDNGDIGDNGDSNGDNGESNGESSGDIGDSNGDNGDIGHNGESNGDNGESNGDNGDVGDSNGDNGDIGDNGESNGDNGESSGDNGDVGDSGVELGDSVGDRDSLWGGDSAGVGDKSRFGDNVGLGATSKLGDSPGQKDTRGDTPSDSATSSLGDTSSFGDTPSDSATKTPGATKTDSATSSPDATKLHGATSNVGDTSSFGDTSSLEDTPSDSATKLHGATSSFGDTPSATKPPGATSSFGDTPSDNATKPHGATSSSGDTSSLGDTPSATSATSPPVGGPVDDLLVPLGHPVPPGWVTLEGDFVLVLALTQSHLGTELVAVPQARPDDGLIHLCYVRAGVSRATLLRALVAMSRGGLGDGGVTGATPLCHVPARAFRLEPLPPAGTMTVDGERVEVGDIQGQIHRGLARLLLPPGPP